MFINAFVGITYMNETFRLKMQPTSGKQDIEISCHINFIVLFHIVHPYGWDLNFTYVSHGKQKADSLKLCNTT